MEQFQTYFRSALTLLSLAIVSYLFLKDKQDAKLNWAVFYSCLWLCVSLVVVNHYCVSYGLWSFNETNDLLQMPLDIYFIWIVFWGILPAYFFKGKHLILIGIILVVFDLLFMKKGEDLGLLSLSANWLVGEFFLISFVWLPAYFWAKISYNNNHLKYRIFLQVATMALFFVVLFPKLMLYYTPSNWHLAIDNIYIIQLGFIIVLPALIAVQDLFIIGNGTPFPYDKTQRLVQSGVYAYIRNPTQWSFTLLFMPLSIYFHNYYLMLGTITSILYTIGISNPQEYDDMEKRFAKRWTNYKNNVPNWYFIWKPKHISNGTLYFQYRCNPCEQLKHWFEKRDSQNLHVLYSKSFIGKTFLQVTYINNEGQEFKSIKALAYGLEHINLAWACLAWFMRLPLITFVLQAIVDAMELETQTDSCSIDS